MCAFVVLGLVFPYQAKRLAWGMSLKWPILCRVGCKATTQSINLFLSEWRNQMEGYWLTLVHLENGWWNGGGICFCEMMIAGTLVSATEVFRHSGTP